ncbi:hypothetical protein [Burkholderia cepacia]|uniref:hypothetical protein n=1 Tax=Burkholderia cepacia TaxID=292 RepID=UPI002AB77ED5|nr:hypothetical protein [Burkholderia cepacia]
MPKQPAKPKAPKLTVADFEWFSLDKYTLPSALRPGTLEYLQTWTHLVGGRAFIKHLLDKPKLADNLQRANDIFERLKNAPLQDVGFATRWSNSHESDTQTVKLLTDTNLWGLTSALDSEHHKLPPSTPRPVDVLLNRLQDSESMQFANTQAHLTINLGATKAQLVRDFTRFIDYWHSQDTITAARKVPSDDLPRWAEITLLAYTDLRLYATLTGKQLPGRVSNALLGIEDLETLNNRTVALKKGFDSINFLTHRSLQEEAEARRTVLQRNS